MSENSFKYKKGDFEIEFRGERSYVEEQINQWKDFLKSKQGFSEKKEEQLLFTKEEQTNIISVKKNISIEDFIELKKPENEIDKTIVAAYYLEKYERQSTFNEIDVYKLLLIDNIDKYLSINLEKGFLSPCKSSNSLCTYTLTFSGEQYVKDGLSQ